LYKTTCNNCPQLKGTIKPNYSNEILEYKKTYLNKYNNIHISTPSEWLSQCSLSSKLFSKYQHYIIPYGTNSRLYKPFNRDFAKQVFGLPKDKIVLMFASDSLLNKRKGFQYLIDALDLLEINEKAKVCILAIGNNHQKIQNIDYYPVNYIKDERFMALAYSAADVLILPSIEDNMPLTMLDSLMCGNPVIGFAIGGIKDIIKNWENGLLSNDINAIGLKNQLQTFIYNLDKFDRNNIRKMTLDKFTIEIYAQEYLKLFNKISNGL
jgi:glycosyltransferase involved in cell wall biosynthesis